MWELDKGVAMGGVRQGRGYGGSSTGAWLLGE